MPPSSLTTTLYYGVGLFGIGIVSFASLTMTKLFHTFPRLWNRKKPTNNDHVKKELEQTISQKDAEIQQLKTSLSASEQELQDVKKQVEHGNQRKTELEGRMMEALVQKENLENELVGREEELGRVKEDVGKVQEALKQTQTLLDFRTSELKVAQGSLSRSDRFSGADVTRMIETLNTEIHQTATIMADEFVPQLQLPQGGRGVESGVGGGSSESGTTVTTVNEAGVGVHEAAVVHTEDILGESMTKMLQTFNHREDNILLQIAFQASMCAFTEWIMDSWCYHHRDSEVELVLQETYEQLRETEEQPVSARWRILTRRYVRQLYPPVEQPNLAYHIFAACANILIAAGLSHEPEQLLLDKFAARFSKRVADIVERAIHLNNAIGDDITSCEFVPIYCTPDVTFDPSTMEAPFENSGSAGDGAAGQQGQEADKILCTTDLGLLRAEKVQGEERTWHNTILLKPKIIMASDLIASPSSTDSPGWKSRFSDAGSTDS
ncbi:hypothetical protein GYMLUDRAFT_47280 [Collybiopsis luxurians FD-317 M1]|uniref:Uncharacterized protein n=1 Tax=Collybiopsis luxurians FD-317 M1 TaxID=944289 RepID=A0A0D0AZV5_9AGAR|nr:hypothetical protein GYMLUDRAFT_47280 [Collybiopsis luxurians FD-317 M1]